MEDERIVAEDLKPAVSEKDGVTGIAASGEEAFQSVKNQKPDLVLMEIASGAPRRH